MDTHELPRISIGTMRVWLRIKSGFAKAVEDKVDQHAKEHNLSADRRNAMLVNAQQYVEKTFEIAQHNIRINGRDFDELQPHEQDAEPFDEALDRQIWALASNRLQLQTIIATERRNKPLEYESAHKELLREHEALDAELTATDSDIEEDADDSELDVDGEVFGQISAVTGELSQTIPSQQERSERSRLVEAEYKALKP
ncbi:hypothetical protein C8R44DRAFT_782415 [Mycena epipterygia]|nr:hypothetical protein C8R44DRAFT_782415 [Mycena epipterygia]